MSVTQNDGFLQTLAVGGETTIDFDFLIYAKADLQLIKTSTLGVITILELTTHYTIADGELNDPAGGEIGLVTPAVAGELYTARSNMSETRSADFQQGGDFFSGTLNQQVDRLTRIAQQHRRDLDKTLGLRLDSTFDGPVVFEDPEDGKVQYYDEDEGQYVNGPTASEISGAATSASAAAASASAASASATAASTSATNAATSATNAATSATNASNSATAAQTAETNAETAETNAETAQAAAEVAQAAAEAAQAAAEAAQAAAETAETNAETAETNAETAETNAETAQAAAEAARDVAKSVTGFQYTYSTTTTASDPGSGFLRFNNATLASATALYVSETTGLSQAIAAELATWDDSTSTIKTKLRMFKQSDAAVFAIFNVTGTLTDNGSWDTLTVAYVTGAGSFSNNDVVTIQPMRTGDKGDTGDTGDTGATGPAGTLPTAAGAGTVDAITANFTPDIALNDQQMAVVISTGANTVTNPTFAPDGLTARTIVKRGGGALVAGDTGAAGYPLLMIYDLANTRWELINPAKVVTGDIVDNNVTLAKLATQAANTILANVTSGAAVPTAVALAANQFLARSSAGDAAAKSITDAGFSMVAAADAAAQTALLSNVVGDSGSGGTKGLVPAPASGDAAAGKFLKADGTWAAPSAGGLIATGSVNLGGAAAISISTAIDASVLRIVLNGYITTAAGVVGIRIGDSGGIETTGYLSETTLDGGAAASLTVSFDLSAIGTCQFIMTLTRIGTSNTWSAVWLAGPGDTGGDSEILTGGGIKATSTTTDRIGYAGNTGDAGAITYALYSTRA